MQDSREIINEKGFIEKVFGEPEPLDLEKLMKKIEEPDVKEVAVFKATPKEVEKRINKMAKGQRRKARKKWGAYWREQKEIQKNV